MKKVLQIAEAIIANGLIWFGLWQGFSFIAEHIPGIGIRREICKGLLSDYGFHIASVIASSYFIYRFYLIIRGYYLCKSFPGEKACKYVHQHLTTGDLKLPEAPETGSYYYFGGYHSYLNTIEDLTEHSSSFIKMTLPMCPYRQIQDQHAYSAFQAAVATVRSRWLGSKKKIVILSESELDDFKKEFAKDFLSNDASEIDKYIRYHYGYEWIGRICLFRGLNTWIKKFFHIDLRWCAAMGEIGEFLLIDKEVAILFKEVRKADGVLDESKSRVVLDFAPEEYLRNFGVYHRSVVTTRKFFNDLLEDNSFFEYCAEYNLAKTRLEEASGADGKEWDEILETMKKQKNFNDHVRTVLRRSRKEWKKDIRNLIKKW